jgi:glutathione S-transferase
MTLKIYGVLRSRASRNVWLAKELGIAYETVPVIQGYRLADPAAPEAMLNTASPAFRAINPNGHIPSIDDGGLVLHESLAINLYLAKKHGGDLAPRDLREDALMTMWSIWAVTECETQALSVMQNRTPNRAVADASAAALQKPFAVLAAALSDGGGHPVGGRFTVADINLAEVLRYAQAAPELFDAQPAVKAWIAACQSRPAFKAMMAERNAEAA